MLTKNPSMPPPLSIEDAGKTIPAGRTVPILIIIAISTMNVNGFLQRDL
jgi:hypothetical protein